MNNSYLFDIKENYIRVALTKIRLGSHNLMIERGRWQKIDIIERQCFTCGKLDDELHAIAECKLYTSWRRQYLPKWLYDKPSMFKLINFLDSAKNKDIRNFGIFCHKVIDYVHKYII